MQFFRLVAICIFILFSYLLDAQNCGTIHSNEFMTQLEKNIEISKSISMNLPLEEKRYVPVKFHLVANSEGNGRVLEQYVYTQMCRLNELFNSSGIVFYIDNGFNFIDDDDMYELEELTTPNMHQIRADFNMSANVFVVQDTPFAPAYYIYGADFIVIQKSNMENKNSSLLSHEFGHLFGLAHVHLGWEDFPYDPQFHGNTVTLPVVESSQGSALVELMNELNCEDAADMLCDTPPEYGFTQNPLDCINQYEGIVRDSNSVLIYSVSNNIMGYNECDEYIFSNDQMLVMQTVYDNRINLEKNYMPDTTQLSETITTIEPFHLTTTEYYNNVYFSWTPVEGAQAYKLLISGDDDFQYETNETDIVVSDLKAASAYIWTVLTVNEIGTCQDLPESVLFFTSVDEVSAVNEIEFVSNFYIYPNPAVDQNFILTFDSEISLEADFSLNDYNGKEIFRITSKNINQGKNQFAIKLENASSGLYNLLMITSEGILSQKMILN